MIASHDSFTYLKPCNPLMRMFSWLWRTQEKSIMEQEYAGVRYFDIRVRRHNDIWRICHGMVDLSMTFHSLREIADMFEGYHVRIVLERGDDAIFRAEAEIVKYLPQVERIIIKQGWRELYRSEDAIRIVDLTYVPWHSGWSFRRNLKAFKPSTIKTYARQANKALTDAERAAEGIAYFVDYA